MNKDTLESIAYENGLQYITTTTAANGYPQNLRGAIVGFNTFDEAKALANKYNLRITTFYKKDGWQLYRRSGDTTWEPLHITASDYGDDYKSFTNDISVEDFLENELLPSLVPTTFGDIITYTYRYEELFDKIVAAADDELVIASSFGDYVETIKKDLMEWSNDSQTWVVGLIDDEE